MKRRDWKREQAVAFYWLEKIWAILGKPPAKGQQLRLL